MALIKEPKVATAQSSEIYFPGLVVENFLTDKYVLKTNTRALLQGVYYNVRHQTIVITNNDVNVSNTLVFNFLKEVYFKSLCFELTEDMLYNTDDFGRKIYSVSDCQLSEKERVESFFNQYLP